MKKRIVTIIIIVLIIVVIVAWYVISGIVTQRNYDERIKKAQEVWLYNGEGDVSLDDLESSFDKYSDSIVGEK